MKNIIKIVILCCLGSSLQNCATNDIEQDFSYESLADSITNSPFRNRKFEYARVDVYEEPSLKIPQGLNGESIKPELKLPDGDNKYPKSQVDNVQQQMLPPNYTDKFDMIKIIGDQLSTVSISVVYGDNDNDSLKLVFIEPLAITLNILNSYFKHNVNYEVLTEKDKFLSGHLLTVKDKNKDLIFVIFARQIDELSSLVKVNAVFTSDGKTVAPNNKEEKSRILNEIRKNLNNLNIKNISDIFVQQYISNRSKSDLLSLSGLLNLKKISFGSYSKKIDDTSQDQDDNDQQDLTLTTAPDDNFYNSKAQPKSLDI